MKIDRGRGFAAMGLLARWYVTQSRLTLFSEGVPPWFTRMAIDYVVNKASRRVWA